MKKIRIGNDFVFNWAIERDGLPENLLSVLEKHLHLSVFDKKLELIEGVDYDITGNVVRIEVTPVIANIIGTYKAEFHYILPDNGLIDDDRKCAVDVDAFQIVAKTAQADDSTEFSMTSDMAIAFKGDKGDSAYQVWLDAGNTGTEEDFIAYLRQPAIDAGASISELEGEIQVSEGLRVQAENERDSAEATRVQLESERLAAETIRQSNEGNRIDNEAIRVQNEAERISKENVRQSSEVDRVEAEGVRVQAEIERVQAESERKTTIQEAVTATNLANEKANLANTAAQSANEAADSASTATQEATTAASLADTARLAIQDDLALKANHGYTSSPKTLKEVEDNTSVKIENLVENGDFANGVTGWNLPSDSTAIISAANNELIASGEGVKRVFQTISQPIGNGDVCYVKADVLRESLVDGDVRFIWNGTDNFDSAWVRQIVIGEFPPYVYSTLKGRFIRDFNNNNTGNVRLHIQVLQYADVTALKIKNVLFFNLTAIFGEGNEPTSEEFELLLATLGIDYFEGEITIPAQKIMQWQLALIRKNKNAIIALGGTII